MDCEDFFLNKNQKNDAKSRKIFVSLQVVKYDKKNAKK